jgi:acyl-CoA reductase-like NAD-dependent aldehyde dehydrogenase
VKNPFNNEIIAECFYGRKSEIEDAIKEALKAFNQIEAGGVMINEVPTFRVDNFPYGGIKNSGFGREGVKYAVEEMTEIKIMVVDNVM